MSKQQTIKAIRMEIEKINQEIDLCIIKGVPYKRYAERHKALKFQLKRLIKESGWFARSFRFASFAMF